MTPVYILARLSLSLPFTAEERKRRNRCETAAKRLDSNLSTARLTVYVGTWLELYFPKVVYEPGTLPGCFMYGYALLAHAIEAKVRKTASFFLSFPYVCPEPVLANDRFYIQMAQKCRFSQGAFRSTFITARRHRQTSQRHQTCRCRSGFFSLPVVYTKPRLYICQDRLGTNIGNVEKGDALPQDITIRDLDVHAVRSSYAITRYASTAIA